MHIAWVVSAQYLESTAGGLYSKVASYRYRMIIPATELKKRGHQVAAIGASAAAGGYEYAVQQLQDLDVVVFGKMTDSLELQARLADAARDAGIRVVVDVCDDHFSNDAIGERYRAVVASADAVSVSSGFLAERIAEMTGRSATVIKDSYEGSRGTPKWKPGPQVEAVWFGHPLNLQGLAKSLGAFAGSGVRMRLVVVTGGTPEVIDWHGRVSTAVRRNIHLEFREWSLEATAQALQACDVVLIPIDRENPFSLSKGPDRVVESLWAGRLVLAHPIPAYEEFSAWAWIGEDLMGGLRWAIDHPAEVVERVARAQEYIGARFSPQVIAEGWESLCAELRAA